ncbi:hypothetical protein [Tannerella forsythia]|uniref:Uncharacterized protein n=1 Tax=Tannerella forsythia TaxID=28112 RepID=A0A3P1XW41_TANFO|nr:hypothetical protein [Tannerella forsythia]RRD63052.1 hypothetical protein EII40_00810 [Tannerella forsythia]
MLEKDSFFSTQVSLVSPGVRGDVPALRGNFHQTSGEGTELPLDRQKVSLRSTKLRSEGTEDRWKATERRLASPEIARVSPDVFWHPAGVLLLSTGVASRRTNLRGIVTQRLHDSTRGRGKRRVRLKIFLLNNVDWGRGIKVGRCSFFASDECVRRE